MSTPVMTSQWKLERYLLQELPPCEMEEMRAAVAAQPALAARLASLRSHNQEFLAERDASAAMARIRAQVSARHESSRAAGRKWFGWLDRPWWHFASFALLLLMVSFAWFSQRTPLTLNPAESYATLITREDTRIKGFGNQLQLFQKVGDSIQGLLDNAPVDAGALLQIRFQVAHAGFAAIVSLDGHGRWTTHLPLQGNLAVAVEPGVAELLPFAYQLDDAPHYEVFWLLTAPHAFALDSILPKGLATAPNRLPISSSLHQTRLLLRKP